MFAPRYNLLHFVSNVRVLEASGDEIKAQSNYLLLQTLVDGPTTIQQSGRYYDTLRARGTAGCCSRSASASTTR